LPTPIQHLAIAEQILASPALPEALRERLCGDAAVRGAFFFGHIAPDVQVVSRQPREATHFFQLPPTNQRPAYEEMLGAHPMLAQSARLPDAQAAFLAGYISHLLLDECWVRQVFFPGFGPSQGWGDRHERLLLHNVLRAWLDRRDLAGVRDGMGQVLRGAAPDDWLPFVDDGHLVRWRDVVADQFEPGAAIRTVEIFAERSRVPDSEFLALLEPEAMETRIFNRVPLAALDRFHASAVADTHDLVVGYLNGCAEIAAV
jgi:hypothetical protein